MRPLLQVVDVMRFKIKARQLPGYKGPSHTFDCPLCHFVTAPDLAKSWTKHEARTHLIKKHSVLAPIKFKVKEKK
jgi:hypothetical protein